MKQLTFQCAGQRRQLGDAAWVMGIVNATPDSFSDGGQCLDPESAIKRGLHMARHGAAILDIGGESTRPGAPPVSAAEEIERVVPVIRGLADQTDALLSVDTSKAAVARAALAAGASIVNDVSGLHRDPEMLDVLRTTQAGCVVMHMRGTPDTMQTMTDYADLMGDIITYFRDILDRTAAAGVARERLILDPGIGFAKTAEQNLELIAHLARLRDLGRPLLLGPSRKSFIGKLLPGTEPQERGWGTAGAVACCVLCGADIVRVHDVDEMRQVAVVAAAIRQAAAGGEPFRCPDLVD